MPHPGQGPEARLFLRRRVPHPRGGGGVPARPTAQSQSAAFFTLSGPLSPHRRLFRRCYQWWVLGRRRLDPLPPGVVKTGPDREDGAPPPPATAEDDGTIQVVDPHTVRLPVITVVRPLTPPPHPPSSWSAPSLRSVMDQP